MCGTRDWLFHFAARPLTVQRTRVAPDYDLHRERALVEAAKAGNRPSAFGAPVAPRAFYFFEVFDATTR